MDKVDGIIVVHQDHVQEEIIICLEQPFRRVLSMWLTQLTAQPQTVEITDMILQIENIIDLMSFEGAKNVSSGLTKTTITPFNVKVYLSR